MTFEELFIGSGQGYGLYQISPKKVSTVTGEGAAPAPVYQEHLDGGMGLGLVPIRLDGTCRFAAIDIDDDKVDHAALYKEVQRRRMPLSVCRSKSGGAHLYIFFREPGVRAPHVIALLKKWAALLGHAGVEIFPKQKRMSADTVGNWINLPYHNAKDTTRYAMGPDGALSLEEFLASVVFYDEVLATQVDLSPAPTPPGQEPVMPPCLQKLQGIGLGKGGRNNGLMAFGTFFKKAYPDDWQTRLAKVNSNLGQPIDEHELETTVLSSLTRQKYNYQCKESPIADHCDRAACLLLPFGVGHGSPSGADDGDDEDAYDQVEFSELCKYLCDPPYYTLKLNGQKLTLNADEIISYRELSKRAYHMLKLLLLPRTEKNWKKELKRLRETTIDIELPKDQASIPAIVIDLLHEFLILRKGARDWDDVLRNLPYEVDGVTWFRPQAFKGHLGHRRLYGVTGQYLSTILSGHGLYTKMWKIKGKEVELWGLPSDKIIEQTEAFTPTVLDKEEEAF